VKKAVLITLAGLLLSFSYVAVSASAGTPDYLKVNYPLVASYEPFTEPPSPTPEEKKIIKKKAKEASDAILSLLMNPDDDGMGMDIALQETPRRGKGRIKLHRGPRLPVGSLPGLPTA
jgi:hypothetical protein